MRIEWSSKLLCLACSQGWWFKTRQSQGSFQRGAAETLQQSFSGQQRRPQSLLKRCSSLLDFTHGAHGERLDPQRMRCDPRLAASWTCSDWTVELSWWSHCELVGNCVARSSAHCCASGGFASLHESVCGIQFLGWPWFQFGVRVTHGILEWFCFPYICAVTIMHVPEEGVEEFEVIYLSL